MLRCVVNYKLLPSIVEIGIPSFGLELFWQACVSLERAGSSSFELEGRARERRPNRRARRVVAAERGPVGAWQGCDDRGPGAPIVRRCSKTWGTSSRRFVRTARTESKSSRVKRGVIRSIRHRFLLGDVWGAPWRARPFSPCLRKVYRSDNSNS